MAHDHHIEDPIKYPFLRKREKAFPWACQDCTLFDGACKVRSPALIVLCFFLAVYFLCRLLPEVKLTTNLAASSACWL